MQNLAKTLDTLDLVIDDVMRIDAKRGLEVRAVLAANRALNEARDLLYALVADDRVPLSPGDRDHGGRPDVRGAVQRQLRTPKSR